MKSVWCCPECSSGSVQVSLPAWFYDDGAELRFVEADGEAEILSWACDDCGESGAGRPVKCAREAPDSLEALQTLREELEFVSSDKAEYPPEDYRGEWMHVNERGNVTLYVRGLGKCDVCDGEGWPNGRTKEENETEPCSKCQGTGEALIDSEVWGIV